MSFLGLIVEGSPVNVGPFPAVDSSGAKFTTTLFKPSTIGQLVLFLLPPPTPIPPNHGVVLYYESPAGDDPNGTGWVFLAGLHYNNKATKIVRTNWESNEALKYKVS